MPSNATLPSFRIATAKTHSAISTGYPLAGFSAVILRPSGPGVAVSRHATTFGAVALTCARSIAPIGLRPASLEE